MGSSPSPTVLIVVVVLVVGWGSNWLRKDGRTDEGRKQAAKSKRRMQAAGVSRVPPENGRGRRTTTRTTTIRATSAYGVYPGKCFFGPWGHRKAPKFSQRHLLQMSKLRTPAINRRATVLGPSGTRSGRRLDPTPIKACFDGHRRQVKAPLNNLTGNLQDIGKLLVPAAVA
jgi:hypothetical protein